MGTGTIFPDEEGVPVLHLHLSCGRGDGVVTGCARAGVRVWHVVEVILTELVENSAIRAMEQIGFKLLSP
jgi:predicted DNA-binding protein with PD1-like motif